MKDLLGRGVDILEDLEHLGAEIRAKILTLILAGVALGGVTGIGELSELTGLLKAVDALLQASSTSRGPIARGPVSGTGRGSRDPDFDKPEREPEPEKKKPEQKEPEEKEPEEKKQTREACLPEWELCARQGSLIDLGLLESAHRYFARMVDANGGSPRAYCRNGGDGHQDARRFSIIIARQGEWGVVEACNKDHELLALAEGSKNIGDRRHAEITALESLASELAAIPLEEREGGRLISACIKIACTECRPQLVTFANAHLPNGPAPVDLACGYPEIRIPELAWAAYLLVFEQNCGVPPFAGP